MRKYTPRTRLRRAAPAVVVMIATMAALHLSHGCASDPVPGTPVPTTPGGTALISVTTVRSEASSDPGLPIQPTSAPRIPLPSPRTTDGPPLHEVLNARRSVRAYTDEPLSLADVGQLLWASQGTTSTLGGRTAPSAGGTYPLEVDVVTGHVDGLPVAGVYRYHSAEHALEARSIGADLRSRLSAASLNQTWVTDSPVTIIISAVYDRTTAVYGPRGTRYVDLEAGHAAQNLLLEAVALGLGAVTVGAFDDRLVREVLSMPEIEVPLYIIPVGRPSNETQ